MWEIKGNEKEESGGEREGRERERERERERDRQTDRERDTERERQGDRERVEERKNEGELVRCSLTHIEHAKTVAVAKTQHTQNICRCVAEDVYSGIPVHNLLLHEHHSSHNQVFAVKCCVSLLSNSLLSKCKLGKPSVVNN